MTLPLTAGDLWPIVAKLPHDEQVRLARMALAAAQAPFADAQAYAAMPVVPGEFTSDDDSLSWEAGGWEEFDAPR